MRVTISSPVRRADKDAVRIPNEHRALHEPVQHQLDDPTIDSPKPRRLRRSQPESWAFHELVRSFFCEKVIEPVAFEAGRIP